MAWIVPPPALGPDASEEEMERDLKRLRGRIGDAYALIAIAITAASLGAAIIILIIKHQN